MVHVDWEMGHQWSRDCGRVGRLRDGDARGIKDAHCSRKVVLCEQRDLLSVVGLGCGVVEVFDGRPLASLCTVGEGLERGLDVAVPVREANDGVDECAEVGGEAAVEEGVVELCEEGCARWRRDGDEGTKGMVEVGEGGLGIGQCGCFGGIDQPADVLEDGRHVVLGQCVFEGEGKRRASGAGLLVCGCGGVALAQVHLHGMQDGRVVAEAGGEGKGVAAGKRAGRGQGGLAVVVGLGGAILGGGRAGLGDGAAGALLWVSGVRAEREATHGVALVELAPGVELGAAWAGACAAPGGAGAGGEDIAECAGLSDGAGCVEEKVVRDLGEHRRAQRWNCSRVYYIHPSGKTGSAPSDDVSRQSPVRTSRHVCASAAALPPSTGPPNATSRARSARTTTPSPSHDTTRATVRHCPGVFVAALIPSACTESAAATPSPSVSPCTRPPPRPRPAPRSSPWRAWPTPWPRSPRCLSPRPSACPRTPHASCVSSFPSAALPRR